MDQAGLTAEEVRDGFAIMRDLKNNPEAALKALQPIWDNLQIVLGNTLPSDLQQKVEDGLIDEATARETARLRMTGQIRERQAELESQRRETQAQRDAGNARAEAVNAWVAEKSADPDFARVQPLLRGQVLQVQQSWREQGKRFDTPQSAVALTKEAYESVLRTLVAQRPRPAIKPTPRSGTSVAAPAAPKSLKEAILNSLGR
jgi:hypothetical protein